ncbi:vitellogenin receptor-like [Venturia canescens]|uniref:vitellogenin receptor-like n=1 Tax=Venturia canescens TaxID=32260 RepID=UPI001C9D65B1|nr:vitellogenin receptor-like [Venturia canescens]XP_043278314.1 vitellogenin receptor-like [Venturia canescens]XP_043278324.1 vitellogenin receptor-like [Venturia canescens]XP_043278331.1 vitellogenin receptor-like [Venturia canescens]
MSFIRYTISIWTCLLLITEIEAYFCGEEGMIIYSNDTQIRELCLEQQQNELFLETLSKRFLGVAASANPRVVYWSSVDVNRPTIMRTREGPFVPEDVIADIGLGNPEKLAVDWVTGNVYFMDSSKNLMGVCTEDGSCCTSILNSTAVTLGGLVLDPKSGDIFWSDNGENPAIWRAGMDGSEPKTFLSEGLGQPKGLAIDYSKERLYWIDWKSETVESVSLGGKDRQRLLQTKGKRLHSIAIFKGKLYWSDWDANTLESMDLATGANRSVIARGFINGMDIYHSSLKPTLPNPCENTNCSQICLLARNSGYSCACKLGHRLNSDLHTCSPINQVPHLAIAATNSIIHYHEEIIGKARIEATVVPILMSRIAYNRKTDNLIVDDQYTNFLYSVDPANSEIRHLTPINSKYFGGIAVKPEGTDIFSAASGLREIHRIREDDTGIFSFPDEPHEILSIPGFQKIFVVFKTGGSKFRIDWVQIVLPDLETVVDTFTGTKVSLAYDLYSSRLYFAEEESGSIQSISVKNVICDRGDLDRRLLGSKVGKPVSLAVSNGKLYWTNRDSNVLNWMDLDDSNREIKSTMLLRYAPSGILDITSVGNITLPDKISCSTGS